MAVKKEDVVKIARLAKLKFSDEEISLLTPQLNKILEYMEQLNKLDTEGVEPLSYPVEVEKRTREDIRKDSMPRESALKNAPEHDGEFFKVPKVIKSN
jgi:aspartyl-tRNA(Asn)/glutamyl-tRNA(Gln) amidotransferase subunit C